MKAKFCRLLIAGILLSIQATGALIGQTNSPVAIDMEYHVVKNKQKYIALAAYSDEITYLRAAYGQNPIQWGVRYDDAITDWIIETLPAWGTLYFENTEIATTPFSITNPDELLYVPDKNFEGADEFQFSVTDNIGSSNIATISLIVEETVTIPFGIPDWPAICNTPAPAPETSGNVETDDWYIDNSHPNATDTPQAGESDPRHGTPDAPRLTLPPNNSTFVAGARVFFGGGIDTPYTLRNSNNWHRWYIPGSPDSPVYFIGTNDGPDKPIITADELRELRLQMQYVIFEGLNFKGIRIYPQSGQSGGNIVFRHCMIDRMNRGTVGAGVSQNIADTTVYFDLHIKNVGFTEPDLSTENDVNGIHISRSSVWILDNLIHGCAGDAVQINGQYAQGIYIGRNKFHSDNENAVDFKRRYDLIFVDNDVWDYRSISYQSSGSDGIPVIINFDTNGQTPTRSTIARNRIWDANGAVRHQGHNIWTTDNAIWHIHHNTNSSTSSYAIQVGSTDENDYTDRVTNNTMSNIDGGIRIWANVNPGLIDHRFMGNIFGPLNDDSLEKLHFKITSNHVDGTTIDYNNYAEPARFEWASALRDLTWMQNNTSNCTNDTENRDPEFIDANGFDLRLSPSSPLIDDNIEHVTYSEFYNQYGRSIQFDINNVPRPSGNAWDIGAFEYKEPTSVNAAQRLNPIIISPNPADDKILILSKADDIDSYEIYNLNGSLILQKKHMKNNLIDVAHLPPGVYFLKLNSPSGEITAKFIKK